MGTLKQAGLRRQKGMMFRTAFQNHRIMYHQKARAYIEKLIRIQTHLEGKNYLRADQLEIREAIEHLQKYLHYYRYGTNEKMHRFFIRNRQRIRTLIPHQNYPGFEKLYNEFLTLQNR